MSTLTTTGPTTPASEAADEVRALFAEAADLRVSQRAAWMLNQPVPIGVRDRVMVLLAAHDAAHVMETPPIEFPHRDRSGETVGPFRIVRPIGRGGMGDVYLADRVVEDYRQRVALKLIRGLSNPALDRRLRSERRILARLEHPGIARLIDGGSTASGHPYFAMEFIDGPNLLDHSDRHHLSIHDRLQLFLKVCDAVRYAHQQLVVHQDLKPNNILVTPEGQPKLLDFGISKLVDADDPESGATRTSLWLTPAYASPEQVAGHRITTLSDVYALGVMLYELLTDELPYRFDTGTPAEVERVICQVAPRRPSAVVAGPDSARVGWSGIGKQVARAAARGTTPERLAAILNGDLDSIVLKALAKEPERRYASVDKLADDLQRFLDGHPVRARPDSIGYRAGKFVARHRTAVAATAITALSLIGGVVATLWQANIANRNATVANEAREEAERALKRSENVSTFLVDMFRVREMDEKAEAAREMLTRGLSRVDEATYDRATKAQMLVALGRAYGEMLEYPKSIEILRRALTAMKGSSLEASVYEAMAHFYLGISLANRYDGAEARRAYTKSLELLDDIGRDTDTLAVHPLLALGVLDVAEGRWDSAESRIIRALEIRQALLGNDDLSVGHTRLRLARLKWLQHDVGGALANFRQALALGERTLPTHHPFTNGVKMQIGDMLLDIAPDSIELAGQFIEGAYAGTVAWFSPEHTATIGPLNSRAHLAAARGRFDEAERLARSALTTTEQIYGDTHVGTARQMEIVARMLRKGGRFADALALQKKAVTIKMEVGMERAAAWTLIDMAGTAMENGALHDALQYATRSAEQGRTEPGGPGTNLVATSTDMLARVHLARGEFGEAERVFLESIGYGRHMPISWRRRHLPARYEGLAEVYDRMGLVDKADMYRRLAASLAATGG